MRLTAHQQSTIVRIVHTQLGSDAEVWLFGSRVDDTRRGGDIDLLIETRQPLPDEAWQSAQLNSALQQALGEQKFDIVLLTPDSTPRPVHRLAKQEGRLLRTEQPDSETFRLLGLLERIRRECHWLQRADLRLQAMQPDLAWLQNLERDDPASETLEAFVSRFGRLQDNLGDKLIPALLRAVAEKTGSALDNLNKAEQLGILWSAQDWLGARNLRNQMVHEYEPDPIRILLAIQHAHLLVPKLVETYNIANRYLAERLPTGDDWPATCELS